MIHVHKISNKLKMHNLSRSVLHSIAIWSHHQLPHALIGSRIFDDSGIGEASGGARRSFFVGEGDEFLLPEPDPELESVLEADWDPEAVTEVVADRALDPELVFVESFP